MSITAHSWTGGDTGTVGRLPMLVPPLAALLYPFALKGFNISVTHLELGASPLSWLSAAACLALAFAMPLIAMLAAMSFSEIGRPTVAQLRAKRTALLAVAAPTLFTFVGVVLTMLHDPVPDTWLWVACWALALALLLRSDNGVPAVVAPRPVPAPLRVAHGVSALALVMIFLTLHIANHFDVPRGRRDVRCADEGFPPRIPQRHRAAGGGRALPLPSWHGAVLRLTPYRGAQ